MVEAADLRGTALCKAALSLCVSPHLGMVCVNLQRSELLPLGMYTCIHCAPSMTTSC
jgi:hypothetical protein